MVHCSIIGCKSRSERKEENITFHSFPKDPEVRKSWIFSTGRSNWVPKKFDRICSKHFLEDCFRITLFKVYLNAFSIPTQYIHEHQEKVAFSELVGETYTQTNETDCRIDSPKNIVIHSTSKATYTPRKEKLIKSLKKQTLLAEKRKQKLALLRSQNQRLEKKNAVLSDIIIELQSKLCNNRESAHLFLTISPLE